MKKLTPKQEAFCREYILDHNGTQAAIRAGYYSRTAKVQACKLLTKGNLKKRISELEMMVISRHDIAIEEIISRLVSIAFFDIGKLFNSDGLLKDISELDEQAKFAVSMIDTVEMKDSEGNLVGKIRKVKTFDKLRALELLGRYKQMFVDRIEERKTVVERKIIKLSGSMPDDDECS